MTAASAHLARIGGASRPTGSEAIADARRYCTGVLQDRGFVVTEVPFEYSQFPGRWATPAAGVAIPAVASAIAALRGRLEAWPWVALILALGVAGAAVWIARRGVLDLPFARARGVNLQATRGEPAVWLVAHLDSKWQPVSMLMRVAGVVIVALSLFALLIALALGARSVNGILTTLWVGSIPLMLSVVGARNLGTLDNASGVAAVLEAAERLPDDAPVGVLITDAEELALAGAAAWARGRAPGIAINCDSVDDDGALVAMYTGTVPAEVISAIDRAALRDGADLRVLRLIPGILTDSVVLDRAGWRTVTLSRGTMRTLSRIHTSRDSLSTMDGRGIAGAARLLAQTTLELR